MRAQQLDRSVDLLVFDGDPAQGNLAAWKTLFVPNANKCAGTWFNWTPTRGKHRLTAEILPNGAPRTLANNVPISSKTLKLKQASLTINVP